MSCYSQSRCKEQELSDACNYLWEMDKHRLIAGIDYKLNLQHGKNPYYQKDVAPEKLFSFLDTKVFERPIVRHFIALLDNYERSTGVQEHVTSCELVENRNFVDALMKTDAIKYVHSWLVEKNLFYGNDAAFRQKIGEMWFGIYRRETQGDSCGFEHVFVGEERDGKIIGLHNWMQIYHEERKALLNYMGHIPPKGEHCNAIPCDLDQLITIQFQWRGELKLTTTSLIGVSPEFEIALYTLCFLAGNENNFVQLGPYCCNIKCYNIKQRGHVRIGAAFCERAPSMPERAAIKIQANVRGHQARKRLLKF